MENGDGSESAIEVHEFRYRRGPARLGGLAAGGLLVATLAAITFAADLISYWEWIFVLVAIIVLIGCLALFFYLATKAPVLLRIGPDGLEMSGGWTAPLAWHDIHRIRFLGETKQLTGKQAWLVADPAPGVIPEYRFKGPKKAERSLLRKIGVRIPLHMLETDAETVIRSIERFKPIQRPSL